VATKTKLTYEDYETFPDDGNRYEIIDGEVYVSPPPFIPHQWQVESLHDFSAAMSERADLVTYFMLPSRFASVHIMFSNRMSSSYQRQKWHVLTAGV